MARKFAVSVKELDTEVLVEVRGRLAVQLSSLFGLPLDRSRGPVLRLPVAWEPATRFTVQDFGLELTFSVNTRYELEVVELDYSEITEG